LLAQGSTRFKERWPNPAGRLAAQRLFELGSRGGSTLLEKLQKTKDDQVIDAMSAGPDLDLTAFMC